MKIGLVIIGNEILSSERKDLNFEFLSRTLSERKCGLDYAIFVKDRIEDICFAFSSLIEKVDFLFVSGGLGLTPDDITLKALSKATGFPLVKSAEKKLVAIENIMRVNAIQYEEYIPELALSLKGSEPIPNPAGVAPGESFLFKGHRVFVLPGVPREFQSIVEEHILNLIPCAENLHISEYFVDTKEADLIGILRMIEKEFSVETFSYPPILNERLLHIVIRSKNQEELNKAKKIFESYLKEKSILYEKGKPG